MKRIVYYTHVYFLDCDLPLIKSLQDRGYDVYLFLEITSSRLNSTLINLDKIHPVDGIFDYTIYPQLGRFKDFINLDKVTILNRVSKVYGWNSLKLRWKFFQKINKISPEVIHLTDFLDSYDCLLYYYRNKIVQVVHDPFPHVGEADFRRNIFRNIGIRTLKKFVLLNERQRDDFQGKYGLVDQQLSTNKLGAYDCLLLYESDIKFDFSKGYVLFFGRISKYKGIDKLLEAMAIVHESLPHLRLVIAGGGDFHFDIEDYKKLEYITFLNRYVTMSELYSLLNGAKFVVCPYIEATQSGVVMTSYTLRKPVIVTDVGGLAEMVEDGKTGLVVEANSVQKLSEAICLLGIDSNLNEQMSANITNLISAGDMSWSNIAAKYVDFYNK
ncbi:glycosyltransferase [Sphingobacterium psychroaquaticum]|uniref:glycosyltransferase family 4 protein n=1 Tax=Sphingobacterium psychroaquaticum TaxID=561061 RepID=UPI00106ACACF|nr:glycosyltransferase family 4 protein [Sphingobacterium psychroaquaticum]QBQ39824.1 glycosyltransferase [Sphingobacterium psychroaquaticum]